MNKNINIQNKKEAIESLEELRKKKYVLSDVKFENVHLMKLNHKTYKNTFSKNDLYANTVSLWELMQPQGNKGSHNYHGLTPEDIVNALTNITEPYCILKTEASQYAILGTTISHFEEPLFVVIEVKGSLNTNINANVNKLVTMFPMSDIERTLKNTDPKNVLYLKNKSPSNR